MQALRLCAPRCSRRLRVNTTRRALSGASSTSSSNLSPLPWFIDPPELIPGTSTENKVSTSHPHRSAPLPSLPAAIPPDSPIAQLRAALRDSPHLEPGTLIVREPIPTVPGPPLPDSVPKGRRKRGRTYAGEGVYDHTGGIWSWIVVAQVKEGTEKRGAIESVIRVVRKTLLTAHPPLPLPPNSRRQVNDGWAMIDAGEFAVHIVSREARERFFPEKRREW